MRGRVLLALGGLTGSRSSATATTETQTQITRSMYNINYRQVDASSVPISLPTSTSSFNWWPYPPGGVATTATSTSILLQTTITSPTLPFSLTTSDPATTIPTTSLGTNSSTTSTPTPSQVTISALPPLSSSALPNVVSHPKKQPEPSHEFKLIYLAPVFALLGVLWGSLAAWFAYGCITRKPKIRNSDDSVGGPRYVPAERDNGNFRGDVEEGRSLWEDGKEEIFCWPDASKKANMEREKEKETEEDPFLIPQLIRTARTSKLTRSMKITKSNHSNATSMALLDLYDSEDESGEKKDEVPWESLRHKSIKRGILEQVKKEGSWIDSLRGITGSSFSNAGGNEGADTMDRGRSGSDRKHEGIGRRARHTRTDSDLLIQDVNLKTPHRATFKENRVELTSDQPTSPPLATDRTTTTRANSSRSGYVDNSDGNEWAKGKGFRIVEESPTHTPAMPEVSRSRFGSGWWWGSGADVDRYTPVPPRVSRSRSRSTSPVKQMWSRDTPHRHAGVLPQSPPQIMSPPLESQLCFTPTVAPSPRRLTSSRGVISPRDDVMTTPTKSAERKTKARKLRSPKIPSLPFPSNPDRGINSPFPDVYRGRLTKPVSRDKTLPPRPGKHVDSTRRSEDLKANGALKKVEEIVQKSWSARDLGEQGVRSLSPSGFGRHL